MKKKYIFGMILCFGLLCLCLVCRGNRKETVSAPVSSPKTNLNEEDKSAEIKELDATYDYSFCEDNSLPVKAKPAKQINLKNERKIRESSDFANDKYIFTPIQYNSDKEICLYKLGGKSIKYKYSKKNKDEILNFCVSPHYLYYASEDDSIWLVPIKNGKLLMEKQKKIAKSDTYELSFIHATDEWVIYSAEDNIIKYNVITGKRDIIDKKIENEEVYASWNVLYNRRGTVIKQGKYCYVIKELDEKPTQFYQINMETFEKIRLNKNVIGVIQDSDNQVVWIQADKYWNYAYYPQTKKKYRLGKRLGCEPEKVVSKFFNIDYDLEFAENENEYNRDIHCWVQTHNPWNFQEMDGDYECRNLFVYRGRMYVNVRIVWYDSEDMEEGGDEDDYFGTEGNLIFSYALKNYSGIREESQLNQIMKKYSKKTYDWIEDTSHYSYWQTGEFAYQLSNVLVLRYQVENSDYYKYVFYDLDTGEYKKVNKNSPEYHFLYYAGVNEFQVSWD